MTPASQAAYLWEECKNKVSVTTVTETAARVAAQVTGQISRRQDVYVMERAQFSAFQEEFAKVCKHPSARLYFWVVDATLYMGCCDCGKLLKERNLGRRKVR